MLAEDGKQQSHLEWPNEEMYVVVSKTIIWKIPLQKFQFKEVISPTYVLLSTTPKM